MIGIVCSYREGLHGLARFLAARSGLLLSSRYPPLCGGGVMTSLNHLFKIQSFFSVLIGLKATLEYTLNLRFRSCRECKSVLYTLRRLGFVLIDFGCDCLYLSSSTKIQGPGFLLVPLWVSFYVFCPESSSF